MMMPRKQNCRQVLLIPCTLSFHRKKIHANIDKEMFMLGLNLVPKLCCVMANGIISESKHILKLV